MVMLILGLLVAPLTAEAPQRTKVPRIGVLMIHTGSTAVAVKYLEAFRQGLRDLGYMEGQNIVIEPRWGEGKVERLPALAAELVSLKVDCLVTSGTQASQAAKHATTTIPIGCRPETDGFFTVYSRTTIWYKALDMIEKKRHQGGRP